MQSRVPLFLLVFAVLSSGCLKDKCTETRTFVQFDPVYKTRDEINRLPSVEMARPLINPGILYVYNDLILINEFREGIHIIDNSNPENPVNTAFLAIEGNEHFAILNNRLQANKYNALITVDITDIQNPRQTSRIENVFGSIWEDPTRGFLVYHRETERTRTLDCGDPNFGSVRWDDGVAGGPFFVNRLELQAGAVDVSNRDQAGGAGIGGSTARFTISQNHLYTVSESDLMVYNLGNPSIPVFESRNGLGWGIETIYPFKERLFIGSNSGMFIYDISTPAQPRFQSQFAHARACDPVVADDNTAFVTLRDGTFCEGFANQLDVIDVSNIQLPFLVASHRMLNPHGLALQGDHLFICEGAFGLKSFDVSNREEVKELAHLKDQHATDVISLGHQRLLVIGKDGFRQYDASNPKKLEMISMIPVQQR